MRKWVANGWLRWGLSSLTVLGLLLALWALWLEQRRLVVNRFELHLPN